MQCRGLLKRVPRNLRWDAAMTRANSPPKTAMLPGMLHASCPMHVACAYDSGFTAPTALHEPGAKLAHVLPVGVPKLRMGGHDWGSGLGVG